MTKILVVEDNRQLTDVILDWLSAEGYLVDCADTGPNAMLRLKHTEYDLVVLDVNLPGLSGLDVCRSFRQKGGQTPIIFLTVNQTIDEKEIGFDAGADDYLTKPVHLRELSARIKAVLKRTGGTTPSVLTAGPISVIHAEHLVKNGDATIDLQPKEYALLHFLIRHPKSIPPSEKSGIRFCNCWILCETIVAGVFD